MALEDFAVSVIVWPFVGGNMLRLIVLYTALCLGANAAVAADLAALKTGAMGKLVVYDAPLATPADLPFLDAEGGEHRLSDYRGKVVLLNLWATWCAPCRKEMPSLDRLQAAMGGEAFQVVTLATGRNSPAKIAAFFETAGVTQLPAFLDEKQSISRAMGVMGLPVTVLIDAEGREVARLIGGAEWDSPEAQALISALIGG